MPEGKRIGPRIFCISAVEAPTVAVVRRGPTHWWHLGRWDVDKSSYEPGAWIRANLYPQRCDLSPDGRWFCYFALKGRAEWKAGWTYVAISRLPWLTALAAWGTCGTWTRGLHFVQEKAVWEVGPPDEGDVSPCRNRFGIAVTRPASFAVERRRGWIEAPDSPPRTRDDMWDETRAERLRMEKARPRSGGKTRLVVHGYFAAFRSGGPERAKDVFDVFYEVVEENKTQQLEETQWADWDREGRLLVATTTGKLQIRDFSNHGMSVQSEVDLSVLAPEPSPPPDEAYRW